MDLATTKNWLIDLHVAYRFLYNEKFEKSRLNQIFNHEILMAFKSSHAN